MGRVIRDLNFTPPSQGGSSLNYACKVIEADSPANLETAVNAWFLITEATAEPSYYLNSIQYDHYASTVGPPSVTHVAFIWLTYVGE